MSFESKVYIKKLNRPMGVIQGRFFILCNGIAAPNVPLIKGTIEILSYAPKNTIDFFDA